MLALSVYGLRDYAAGLFMGTSLVVAAIAAYLDNLPARRRFGRSLLDGYLRCRRGAFRLVPLAGGRTRLEGSTWYECEIHPQCYSTLWSDMLIQRIHRRVLDHIRRESDRGRLAATGD